MNSYVLMGNPTALARCRVGNRRVWDSQKQIKLIHGIDIAQQHNNRPMFKGPLLLDVIFIFDIPKKTPAKKAILLIDTPYTGKIDLDNMIKYIGDVCTGILYDNDNVITNITAKKVYGDTARTIFSLRELHEENNQK